MTAESQRIRLVYLAPVALGLALVGPLGCDADGQASVGGPAVLPASPATPVTPASSSTTGLTVSQFEQARSLILKLQRGEKRAQDLTNEERRLVAQVAKATGPRRQRD